MSNEKNYKLIQGNEACVEGALAAGMKFFAGYPITPSTEVAEISAQKLPQVGGKFIQMEDEIASMAAIIGGSLAGLKSMTATSGPGFSLMQENLGYASIAEIPCVIVNVQRGGPSTGLPTSPAQGEVMQAKWGTHGDHPIIALTPNSVQETYEYTIKAFNLAEKYRTPVIMLMDETVGHMREKLTYKDPSEIEIIDRKKPTCKPDEYLAYKADEDMIPPMASFGEGYRYHVTGLTHDETGFPTNNNKISGELITRLVNKVEKNVDDMAYFEEYEMEDAEVVIIAFGGVSRSAKTAIDELRKSGKKVGLFRPITIWPMLEKQIDKVAEQAKEIYVAEMNLGQYFYEVDRIAGKKCPVKKINKVTGELITPNEIIEAVNGGK
ncbi:2-oxoglutarate ferredoxin oxidoreductase subunit alpha [Sedimentibacter acidaminivorans]|jgi:2-oxoglutarate/2-oxoacid ferredoxin oxidoreductase subunit alpha|uniref:2-oxoglutarate ferredoxin oxidoreductase subunit alpha n=1 Tax=Sedimentibacter acidaminivorans TaxID=913099 RepID=A0ABS4GCK2_9FIRM|nr:2-oxoacid:acceptor oxidoreductase subunit alpha [Sedimentibacter acidaminivorans]MBP1925401.1 2-oxoglutarate ferredoxin oxidoreductase subunit alpha [Sedimentibacter acidaminivorans]